MNCEIVFVHLGEEIPEYLQRNCLQTQKNFPDTKVTLITNAKINSSTSYNTVNYRRTNRTELVLSQIQLDIRFRDSFWVKTLERLLAVLEYQIDNQVSKLIHVESDVLIFPNLPLKAIQNLRKATWTRYSETKCVGAFIYLPAPYIADLLLQESHKYILEYKDLTDMTLLNKLSENKNLVDTFSHHLLTGGDDGNSIQVDLNDEVYSGFFDPAQIGMWLTGEDPRNHLGITTLHLNELFTSGDSPINPTALSYFLNENNELFAVNSDGVVFPIWTLHIHSKNVKLFSSNNQLELARLVCKAKDHRIIRYWSPILFSKLVIENIKRGTFLAYTKQTVKYIKVLLTSTAS